MKKIDAETRSRRIALNVSPSLDAQIRAIAKLRGISATEFIIRAVQAELARISDKEKATADALIDARKKYEAAVDYYRGEEDRLISLFDYGDGSNATK